MTEVPEHLLRRSRERRAALGLGGDAPAETPAPAREAASTPAETPAAAPPETPPPVQETAPAPPPPEPVYLQAAKTRKQVPYWAMAVLVVLPVWGWVYLRTLEPVETEQNAFTLGADIYAASCASCHGGGGEGGVAPALIDGAVVDTFPDWRDHMAWVRVGGTDWPADTYGEQGASPNAMPSFRNLDDQELAQVVLYERELAGEEGLGEDPEASDPELEELFLIAAGEMTFADAGLGPLSERDNVSEADVAG